MENNATGSSRSNDPNAVFDCLTQLRAKTCDANYMRLLRQWDSKPGFPPSVSGDISAKLPTTHTMGLRRIESVLLDFRRPGLVCAQERDPNDLLTNKAKWKGALEAGLQFYVFSYHGIHQPYYASTKDGLPDVPVGIFIDTTVEDGDIAKANATYRDLYAGLPGPVSDWFFKPLQARELCAHEVNGCFDGDFWKYWGNPSTVSPAERLDFLQEKWADFYEFHFLKCVPPHDFMAVLLPDRQYCSQEGVLVSSRIVAATFDAEIKSQWPRVKVVYYDYSEDDPDTSFLEASFWTANWFAKHGEFPNQIGEAVLVRN